MLGSNPAQPKSIIFKRKGGINISPQGLLTSFTALFLALVFNDVKTHILDDLILKVALNKVNRKKYTLSGVEINMENILKCVIHVVLAVIFLIIVYFSL